jgi:hypothetical protein
MEYWGKDFAKVPKLAVTKSICNDYHQELHLDSPQKPGFQKTLACHCDLRNLRGRPRNRGDLVNESAHRIATFDIAHVNGGIAPFFSVHTARGCPGR